MPKRQGRKKPELILGFVGPICVGKGLAIEYLVKEYGFYYSSTSDRIREEIKRHGLKVTRKRLQKFGGELRKKFGSEVLAKRTWDDILHSGAKKAVVDAIRSKGEIEFLKRIPGFYLIAVLAKPKIRFQRIVERGRDDDPKKWEEFLKMEERDKKAEGRDIGGCVKMADFRIENNGTIEELESKIKKVLRKLPAKKK